MVLVGHMQIDSMPSTTPFGLLANTDSNHLPLASDSSKTIGRSNHGGRGYTRSKTVDWSQLLVSVPMAALAHFDHHQGGICKHVNFSSKSPNCKKFNTASLTIICARCSKDMDLWFALIISRQVALSTKSFIIANINMSESYGVFCKKRPDFGDIHVL